MKINPLLYLLISCIILASILLIATQAETIKAQAAEVEEARHLQEVEAERERVQAELEAEQRAREEAERERKELEGMLLNRARTYEAVMFASNDRLPSRGRQITGVNMVVNTKSGLTAEALDAAFERIGAWGMVGTGAALIEAERLYDTNALILAGIAHLESGGGNSSYAKNRNNLCGLGAYTNDHDKAFYFSEKADSIFYLAELLSTHYSPGGKHYGGSYDLNGIGCKYAADPMWAKKTAGRMGQIMQAAVDNPGAMLAAAEAIT